MIENNILEDVYPLSPMQSGLLFQSLYAPESDAYFVQSIFELYGCSKIQFLKLAWETVIKNHPILRTGFFWKDGDIPFQYVFQSVPINFTVYNWKGLNIEEKKRKLQNFIKEDRQKKFDLTKPPLFRLSLIQYDTNKYYLIWSQHHILLDGWCFSVILNDVLKTYEALKKKTTVLFEPRRPYRDYIGWLQQQDINKAEAFWKDYLHHIEGPTHLSFNNIIEQNPKKDYDSYTINFSFEETERVKEFAQSHNLTLNTVIQGAVGVILKNYTQQEEVIMGVTVSGRSIDLPGVEDMVGLFINTLPLRISFKEKNPLLFFKNIQEQMQAMNDYAYVSLSQIQSWSDLNQSLFNVIFVFENYPFDEEANITSDFTIECIQTVEKTEYPLNITIVPDKQLRFNINYQTKHFNEYLIKRFLDHLKELLQKICTFNKDPFSYYIEDFSFLTAQENSQLLIESNNTKVTYSQDKCIHELFEYQVTKTPDNIALVYKEDFLTYKQLNEKSNQLAHYLRDLGVGPDTLVAIAVERSFEMIIGILAVLKAGGAYVPLDPSSPQDRLQFILEDSKACILITEKKIENMFLFEKNMIINFELMSKIFIQKPKNNLVSKATQKNLLCIIYTSGSSGKPKGVLIDQRSMLNRFEWMWNEHPFMNYDICCQKTSLSFGDSIWEIFGPLLKGIKIIIISLLSVKDPQKLIDLIFKESVTRLILVPSLLNTILSYDSLYLSSSLKSLRLCVVSGESLPPLVSQKFRSILPANVKLLNLYGSTEVGADVTAYEENLKTNNKKHENKILTGRPISNTQVYLLDNQMNLVPLGIVGEIYIGGLGLARGYLNQPDLTAERFIPNPFLSQTNEKDRQDFRLYRTGDLARYLSDGNIEFLGRADSQVKIRGFRIELGEIESMLNTHKNLKQTTLVAEEDKDGVKNLIAYIVPQSNFIDLSTSTPSPNKSFNIFQGDSLIALTEDLRQHLSSFLPNYMIPSFFVFIDKIPLNLNGKTDYKKLSIPNSYLRGTPDIYIEPKTTIEKKLCFIWSEFLKKKNIGIHDNFFKIGGHSLLAAQVIIEIHQKISKNISVVDIFKNPTIHSLSILIESEFKDIPTSTVLEIQISNNYPAFFLIHPAGGLSYSYIGLAEYIQDTPIYGINNPNYENFDNQFNSIEETAKYYIILIKKIQKEGPYLLGGWSFGGLVAYEIAQQLILNNEKVENLILIDTDKPKSFKQKLSNRYKRLKYFKYLEIINNRGLKNGGVDKMLKIMEYNFLDSKLKSLFYSPSQYKGKLTILKSNQYDGYHKKTQSFKKNGWKKLAKNLCIIEMSTPHEDFFDKKHISSTAKNINTVMKV